MKLCMLLSLLVFKHQSGICFEVIGSFLSRSKLKVRCHQNQITKNDTDAADYYFDADQPILIILAERICYQMVIYYSTSPN